jgi:2-oxoglutarate ferredoxin oxidoreductase subunit delta
MAIKGKVTFDIEMCKGCELCVDACPQKSVRLSSKLNAQGYHYAVQIQDNCTGCTNCALVCPDAVITVYRETRKKDRVPVARISGVTENITVTIDEPAAGKPAGAV